MLIERLDEVRREISPSLDPKRRSKLGQFMTPGHIASDMASMFDIMPQHVRLLDAGAGMGSLTAAFVTAACQLPERPSSIDVTCYEVDADLSVVLQETLRQCAVLCGSHSVAFSSRIISDDYILYSAERAYKSRTRDGCRQGS